MLADDQAVKELDLQNILHEPLTNEITVSKDSPYIINLILNQEELNLPDGDYRFHIEVNLLDYDKDDNTDIASISFLNQYNYMPAVRGIARNQSALLLYFPDHQYNHMIPISRILPYTSTPLRATIDNLIKGPDEGLDLPQESPIPSNITVSLSQGVAGVNFYGDMGIYETNSSNAYIAVKSLVESLGSIREVNRVQFTFNNRIVDSGLHGHSMREPHSPSQAAKVYAALVTENRLLLTPITLSNSETVEGLFSKMKYSGAKEIYNNELLPTIPETVQLLNHSIADNRLTLEFNDEFLKAYNNDPIRQLLMVDAILFSFTSLSNVDTVEIKINNKILDELHGVVIPQTTVGLHINPEE